MTFGSDAGKMHTGGLGLLLGGLDTINTAERNASHALQFGDILLPSTIDGCVDPESSLQTQQSFNQIKGGSGKSRAHRPHSRGRGRRGRDSKNKNITPPQDGPPPSTAAGPSKNRHQDGQKMAMRHKKKKDSKKKPHGEISTAAPPPGLSQNAPHHAKHSGKTAKPGPKKGQQSRDQKKDSQPKGKAAPSVQAQDS
jgi:hypothetical protein